MLARADEPSKMVEEIDRFKNECPGGRIALLADHYVAADMVYAFDAGANALFTNTIALDAFVKALELVMLGETILPRELLPHFLKNEVIHQQPHEPDVDLDDSPCPPNGRVPRLSFREKSVLRCIMQGASNTARIAVLAERIHQGDMIAAFRAGANVYFIKAANCTVFIKALELVMLGETILPAEFLSLIREHEHLEIERDSEMDLSASPEAHDSHLPRLSTREKCILRCLAEGSSNKLIVRKIEIAEATVKVHVKAILRKIGVHNRTQAAIWAMNNGSVIQSKEIGPAAAPPTSPLAFVSKMQFARPVALPRTEQRGRGAIVVRLSGKTT